jgi:hypothetical protein
MTEVHYKNTAPETDILSTVFTSGAEPRLNHVALSPGEKCDVLLTQMY